MRCCMRPSVPARAVEIRTTPSEGIDLDALTQAIEGQGVAACMFMPNFQNPLGFCLSDQRVQFPGPERQVSAKNLNCRTNLI